MILSNKINLILIIIFSLKVGIKSGTFFNTPEHQSNHDYYSNEEDDPTRHNIYDVPLLIESYGYPAERHTVITDDGYILEIHRIPHGKNIFSTTTTLQSSTDSSKESRESSKELNSKCSESSLKFNEEMSESSSERPKKRLKKILREKIKKILLPGDLKESSREFLKESSREFLKEPSGEFFDESSRELSKQSSQKLPKDSSRENSKESSLEVSKDSSRESSSKSSSRAPIRPVAFLVHCSLCTSSIWVMQGPKKGLGFLLADEGYDVWMLNVRGTTYSSKHIKYSEESKQFWDFSWHESGIYDAPTSIDYILQLTNNTKVTYIGYSMGTTIFFTMASYRPEYNAKVDKMIALAPAAYLHNATAFIFELSDHLDFIVSFFNQIKAYQIPPRRFPLGLWMQIICDSSDNELKMNLCAALLDFSGKIPIKNVDWRNLKYYFKFFPDRMSVNSFIHLLQIKISDRFELYDYGADRNARMYGTLRPPLYNLTKITTPVHLFYSLYDSVTPPSGVAKLSSMLPSSYLYEIDIPYFSHAHFCWGVNTREIVYDEVIDLLRCGKLT